MNLKSVIEVSPYMWKYTYDKLTISYPDNDNSIESYNIKNGDILTFYLQKDEKIHDLYNLWIESLQNDLYKLHNKRIIPNFDLENLMQLCHKLGYFDFWIYNAYTNLDHKNVKDTLSYIMSGKHFGYHCNECKMNDFAGIRYNSLENDDYDLCESCFKK